MSFQLKIEETIDSLLSYQTTLKQVKEKKSFSLEKESVQKMMESLTAHLCFLLEKKPKLSLRIQSKAYRLQKVCSLQTLLPKKMKLRTRRLKKKCV